MSKRLDCCFLGVQFVVLAFLSLSGVLVSGLYLPGVAPQDYKDDAIVDVKVIKLDSVKTQLPYKYYSLPFCSPKEIIEDSENLGEILSGDRIQNSLYDVQVKKHEQCKVVCYPTYTKEQLQQFAEKIEDEYRIHWSVDGMPAATKYFTSFVQSPAEQQASGNTKPEAQFVAHYEKGFPLGFVGHAELTGSKPGVKYLNNHLSLIIQYNEDKATYAGARIVGFEVEARSIKHKYTGATPYKQFESEITSCNLMQKHDYQPVSDLKTDTEEIIWTYDVVWEPSTTRWATRWEIYTKMTDSKIHWFSIINSIMIVLFLSGMVAVIFLRILNRDFQRYNNEPQTEEEQKEETGWKLIHGDVFRPPANGEWLAVLVGTGVQVFAMTLVTLVVAALGFLSPANRGGLLTALLFLFVFMGFLAGYYSTRVFKMFGLTNWKSNAITTGLFFPGLIFSVFFILNLVVWSQASSGAVPFLTLSSMLLLWLFVSAPLAYFGAFIAFRVPVADPPCKVNNLCRLLPPDSQSAWYTSPHLSILLGGILPFAAVFIEIFFIMSSVWLNQFYLVFGFLFIVFIILLITCAEITIVLCYFQLCNEDYHWWWRSYLTPGSSALYLFLYSILYFSTKLQIVKFVSALLFFGYMLLVSAFFFVLTGTIGYVACYAFVHKIYSSIKVD